MNVFVSIKKCYIAKVLDDGHMDLLGFPTKKCNVCKEVNKAMVVVSSNERKSLLEDYCYAYCGQIKW